MGSKVEVKTFSGRVAIPASGAWTEKFPVLVQVMAPPQPSPEEMRLAAGVDVVALLDTSESMNDENRLAHMTEAMKIVIDKLGDDDRLAIVSFNAEVETVMKLTKMCADDRREAASRIDKLRTAPKNNMCEALRVGAQILVGRESQSRLGCMMFLSDGGKNCHEIFDDDISDEFPAYTFGLGVKHNPKVMKHIADCTRGTYSFVNQDISKIKDAFEFFIDDVKSVAARHVKISIETHTGVTVSEVRCGYQQEDLDGNRPAGTGKTVTIRDMYACETKSIVVYLTVAEGATNKLVTVSGSYETMTSAGDCREISPVDVCVLRPQKCSPEQSTTMHPKVAARLALMELEEGINAMGADPTCQGLEELLVKIKGAQYCSCVPAAILSEIDKTVKEMIQGIGNTAADDRTKSGAGLPYILSWLTCCKWQRAIWVESGCIRPAVDTDSGCIPPEVEVQQENSCILPAVEVNNSAGCIGPEIISECTDVTAGTGLIAVACAWWKLIVSKACAWRNLIVSKPWLFCGALLLAVALLYLLAAAGARLMLQGSSWWWRWSTPTITTGDVVLRGHATSTNTLLISEHTGWNSIEKELVEVVHNRRKEEEGEIGSLFHQAASSDLDMDHEIQRYLYMAIVHATVLRSRRLGTSVASDKEVRRAVSMYLQRMPKAMESMEIPSFERTTLVEMKQSMDRYLYSTIVQSSVVQASYWEPTIPPPTELGFFVKIWNSTTTTISMTWSIVKSIVTTRKKEISVSVSELQKQLDEKAEQLKEKTELVLLIQQQLQEKKELVVRIEQELRKKETVVVTLREEVTSTKAELSTCSLSVDKVKAQLTACRRKGRWLEGKISELQDPQGDAHADGLDGDQDWELQKN